MEEIEGNCNGQTGRLERFSVQYKAIHGHDLDSSIPKNAFAKADAAAMIAFNEMARGYTTPMEGDTFSDAEQLERDREVGRARLALPSIRDFVQQGDDVSNAGWAHTIAGTHAKIAEGAYDMMMHPAYLVAHLDTLKQEVPALAEYEEFQRGERYAVHEHELKERSNAARKVTKQKMTALGYEFGGKETIGEFAGRFQREVGFDSEKGGDMIAWLHSLGFDVSKGDNAKTWFDKIGFEAGKDKNLEEYITERRTSSAQVERS